MVAGAARARAARAHAPARCRDVDRPLPRIQRGPGVLLPGVSLRDGRAPPHHPRVQRPRPGEGPRAAGPGRWLQRGAVPGLSRSGAGRPRAVGPGAVGAAAQAGGRPPPREHRPRHLTHPRLRGRALGRRARADRGRARSLAGPGGAGGEPGRGLPLPPAAGDASHLPAHDAHRPRADRARVLPRGDHAGPHHDRRRRVVAAAGGERPGPACRGRARARASTRLRRPRR
jgi:hypothetical protein